MSTISIKAVRRGMEKLMVTLLTHARVNGRSHRVGRRGSDDRLRGSRGHGHGFGCHCRWDSTRVRGRATVTNRILHLSVDAAVVCGVEGRAPVRQAEEGKSQMDSMHPRA